jgi:hypothetical protein
VIDDLEWTFDLQTSIYDFLESNYDILQAINMRLPKPPYNTTSDGSKATKMTTQPQKISQMRLLQIIMLTRYAT